MLFDEDNFEIALDRLGLRSFDLLNSYVPELAKQIKLEEMAGSQYREVLGQKLEVTQQALMAAFTTELSQ